MVYKIKKYMTILSSEAHNNSGKEPLSRRNKPKNRNLHAVPSLAEGVRDKINAVMKPLSEEEERRIAKKVIHNLWQASEEVEYRMKHLQGVTPDIPLEHVYGNLSTEQKVAFLKYGPPVGLLPTALTMLILPETRPGDEAYNEEIARAYHISMTAFEKAMKNKEIETTTSLEDIFTKSFEEVTQSNSDREKAA